MSLRRGISESWACDALAQLVEDRTLGDSLSQRLREERACYYYGEGYGKGFAVGGSVGFRKGWCAHLYNCIVGAVSRGDF